MSALLALALIAAFATVLELTHRRSAACGPHLPGVGDADGDRIRAELAASDAGRTPCQQLTVTTGAARTRSVTHA